MLKIRVSGWYLKAMMLSLDSDTDPPSVLVGLPGVVDASAGRSAAHPQHISATVTMASAAGFMELQRLRGTDVRHRAGRRLVGAPIGRLTVPRVPGGCNAI